MEQQTTKKPRGFAAMSPERQREIAGMGGKAAHAKGRAHVFTPDEARAAGKKGGAVIGSRREHMREIGKRGGSALSEDREYMREIGRKGGAAAAALDGHMAKIGRASVEARRRRAEGRS